MGIIDSLQVLRDYLAGSLMGNSQMHEAVDDAAAISHLHRPYGPETTPRGLPHDIPVFNRQGFRRRPSASISPEGDVSLTYEPREEFDAVVRFYEEQLPAQRWTVMETHDDSGDNYRARRFDVQKGMRQGSIAVEESSGDLGPFARRLVTVSIDIPNWQ